MLPPLILLLASSAALQPAPATPAVKRCPDGSTLRVEDACLTMPNHGYLTPHGPSRREMTERWWCGNPAKAYEARLSVELVEPRTPRDNLYHRATLLALSIDGRPAAKALSRQVAHRVAALKELYAISGRCLYVPSGGTIGILILSHFNGGQQREEVELR